MTTTVPTDGLPTDIAIPSDTERQGYDTISTVTSDIHSPRDTAYQKTIRGSHEVPYIFIGKYASRQTKSMSDIAYDVTS